MVSRIFCVQFKGRVAIVAFIADDRYSVTSAVTNSRDGIIVVIRVVEVRVVGVPSNAFSLNIYSRIG